MTANQCERPYLPNPLIYETFSVCSLRSGSYYGISLYTTITNCCSSVAASSPKHYQCWNYCAVPEPLFDTWFSCVSTALNETEGQNWGAGCQKAADSPVSTATTPYPASYTQPANPNWYPTKRAEVGWGDGEGLGKMTATEAVSAEETGLRIDKVEVKRAENDSPGKTMTGLSLGGLACAMLLLSILA